MSFTVGIGIVTYNRKEIVSDTIDKVRAFTRQPNAALVVADDGSSDGTLAMLRDKQVPVITGINMGIAWNKNRALFLLAHMLGCETVILLEDDTQPNRAGWEAPWMQAARLWGHVNYAGDWLQKHFISGAGTPTHLRDLFPQHDLRHAHAQSVQSRKHYLNMRAFQVRIEVRLAGPVFVEQELRRILGGHMEIVVHATRFLVRGRDEADQCFLQFRFLAGFGLERGDNGDMFCAHGWYEIVIGGMPKFSRRRRADFPPHRSAGQSPASWRRPGWLRAG